MPTFLHRCINNLHRPTAGSSGRSVVFQHASPRNLRRVPFAAGAETDANTSYVQMDAVQRRKDLELEIQLAVKGEDFKKAAMLKEELEELNRKDPVTAAKKALEQAIKEERYTDAGRIKAQIKQLEAELGPTVLVEAGLLTTNSTAVTHGIKVQVQSFFLPTKSMPSAGRYMFAYHVTISNETSKTIVMLRSRHWVITDARSKTEEIRGLGVVGEQPILLPGKSHEYTSGCPLATPQGSMEGEYTMVLLSEEDGQWAESIEVKIGKFMLDAKGPHAM